DVAINSLHELEMRQFKLQKEQRIMSDEIIDGEDQLGVLLMGHDFKSWWCGSLLSIHEARKHVPHQQATTLQVAISVVAATIWMINNPKSGVCLPDDINHEDILKISVPYIRPFISEPVDWTPLKNLNTQFTKFDIPRPPEEDVWQFTTFLVDHAERKRAYTSSKATR
ncbi:MAG: homospermidine synthase, partial [Candidatus Binatota bacterium]